jgi:hypothetical protein
MVQYLNNDVRILSCNKILFSATHNIIIKTFKYNNEYSFNGKRNNL